MPILYKSSTFETYSYFLIYPILIIICIYFISGIIKLGDFGMFNIIMLLIFIFILIKSIDSIHKLRYVEVTEENIIIKTIMGNKIIEFKNVEYVYNLMNINGNSLIIWYKDPKTQKSKVILVRPDEKNPAAKTGFPVYSYGSSELSITKFIKEKAIKENPNYLFTNSPRWFLFGFK